MRKLLCKLGIHCYLVEDLYSKKAPLLGIVHLVIESRCFFCNRIKITTKEPVYRVKSVKDEHGNNIS